MVRVGVDRKNEDPASPLRPIESASDICALLARQIAQLEAIAADPFIRARTIGYLCGTLLKAFEIGEVEQRLCALEETLKR